LLLLLQHAHVLDVLALINSHGLQGTGVPWTQPMESTLYDTTTLNKPATAAQAHGVFFPSALQAYYCWLDTAHEGVSASHWTAYTLQACHFHSQHVSMSLALPACQHVTCMASAPIVSMSLA